jgi:RNA polymerase sigma-70 factor (ECF subfamily)
MAMMRTEPVLESLEGLLQAYSQGDKKALDEIDFRLRPYLYYCALRILHNEQDAEDAVQETFFKVMNFPLSERSAISNVKAWIHRICTNWCLDRLRWRKLPGNDGETLDPALERPSTSIEHSQMENSMLLDSLIENSGLSGPERTVTEMRRAGFGNGEVGQMMDRPESTVCNLYRSATDKMIRWYTESAGREDR